MKLLLSSLGSSPSHDKALADLAGKALGEIRVGYIENAYDVYHDPGDAGRRAGDLAPRWVHLRADRPTPVARRSSGPAELLGHFDAFLLAGGNPYYLRSLMKLTGADVLITERVQDGAIYAGASAAAVVAGPTLRHFDQLDDPGQAEELVWDGLGLTQIVVAPNVDNPTSVRAAAKRVISALPMDTPSRG